MSSALLARDRCGAGAAARSRPSPKPGGLELGAERLARSGSGRRRSPAPTGRTRVNQTSLEARRDPRSRSRSGRRAAGCGAACASARGRSTRWSDIRITTRVEPAGLERERLGARDARVDAVGLRARDHRLGGVDRPHARELALLERLGEPAGAAADLEDAAAAQAAEPHERVEDLPTSCRRPGGAPRSARRGASKPPETGAVTWLASPRAAAPARAPPLTSAGSPRSRNGHLDRRRSRAAGRGRERLHAPRRRSSEPR